jgi:hypothetical protein
MKSHERFRRNVRLRLDYLGVSAYRAAVDTGHAPSWLTGLLNPRRSTQKVASSIIDDVAIVLGVPPYQLINPRFNPARYREPEWMEEHEDRRPERDRDLPGESP